MNVLVIWIVSGILYLFFLTGANSLYKLEQARSKTPSGPQQDPAFISFLRTRSSGFVSSSKPVRPYSLSMNGEDYHYAPKPKHLRPAQLLRVLGSSFDPFWMSIERPADAGAWTSKDGSVDTETLGDPNAPVPNANDNGFNFSASPELTEGAARYRRKLEKDANDLHFPELPAEVASAVRDWLVRSATCALHYRWVHLAPVFWPRWMRHTDCEQSRESRSCSFPSGMTCQRAQTTQIKMLAWHCWGNEEVGAVQRRTAVVGNGGKRCLWRQVPYPVVTACKCSCK